MKKAFLFLLSLFAFIGVQAQTSPWVGNEVGAGEFYLYNVESGLWLQNNDSKANDWSTRAAIGTRGLDFVLAGSEGAYTLGAGFGSASINPDNNYLDTGNNPAWTFTPVEIDGVTNAYNIKCDNKVLGVVKYNESGKQDNLFTQTGDERWYLENPDFNIDMTANNTWQLVTKEERLAKMQADASVDNPQDASWLIPSADFANNDRRWDNLWTKNLVSGNGRAADGNGINGSKCVESWNSGNSIDFYISINVPNGTYKLSVQGYYRDGNVDDVVARRDDGTETIRGYYYANEVTHPLMSILDEAKDAKVDGAWDTERSGRWYPDSQNSANKCFNLHKGYVNPEIEVVVTTGVLKIGIGKTGGVGGDWIVVDNFKLTYLGNNIDLSTYLEALQSAINAGNAFDTSNTSDALAQALSDAISDGQAALSSSDPDVISEATAAITTALNNAKAVDLSVLNATIALAKKEGIDTSEAEALAASATQTTEVNDALFDLRAARKVKAQAMPDIYAGSEPAEGKVYIYNLGTGLFLGTGSSYNTHCAVDQVGIEVELIASGEGFKIKTNRGGGWLAKGNEASENASVYVDSWNGDQVWQFLPVDGKEGVYNISFDGTTNDLLGYNPHTLNDNNTGKFWGSIGKMRTDVSDPMNQWKIITAEEREALLAKAGKDNPVDASYLIKSPSMNAQDSRDADWTREVNGGNGGAWVNNTENHGYEVWNADDFKIHQTIEGLTPGLYEVSVSGFWREGDGGNQAGIVNNGGALQQKAYLYANDAQALLANIASCPDFVPGIATQASDKGFFPNWPGEGLEYFETGAFKTTLNVVVEEDGTLTIGVGCDEKVAWGDWTVIDNFRLTYLGEASNYDRALTSIKDGQTYRVFTEVDGEKYYLTPDGFLANSEQKAGTYTFHKVKGQEYEYGFQLLDSYFTNPPVGGNPTLANGHIATDTNSKRDTWEAQVFFQNADGKFAIRATNAAGGESSWSLNAKTFWTVNDGPKAEYSFDQNYVWQIEENVDPRPALFAEIKPITNSWGSKMQKIDGLVTDASMYSTNAWINESIGLPGLIDDNYGTYLHTTWQGGVTEAHYLQAELPEAADKFYFYFVKRDPINNGNVNNRPTDILISGSNDGETFTEITEINQGLPTSVPPVDYMSGLVTATEAYKYIRFTVLDTNNHATDSNGNKFFTFSEFYVLPSTELFDDAAELVFTKYTDIPLEGLDDLVERVKDVDARLSSYFKDVDLNLVLNGEVKATETVELVVGKEAPEVPAAFRTNADVVSEFGGLVYFTRDVDQITEETTEINYTAEDAISESFDNAKWFNMTIRNNSWWVSMNESEPYPTAQDTDLTTPESQWAFGLSEGGDKLIIWNRAAGADMVLTNTGETGVSPYNGNNVLIVAMREGSATWDFAPSSDGFVIHQVGTGDNQWVNQNGGAGGPLSIWDSGAAKADGGSVLRIFPVEVEDVPGTEFEVTVNSTLGSFYEGLKAPAPIAEILEALGAEQLEDVTIEALNADGNPEDGKDYGLGGDSDGWRDAEGNWSHWGDEGYFYVKADFAAEENQFWEIGGMQGKNTADDDPVTYTATYRFTFGSKTAILKLNLVYEAPEVTDLTFDDLEIAATEELDVKSELGAGYEGLTATVDIDNILATLEVESLADVTIAAVQPDGTLDLNYKLGSAGSDGWRDADGTWKAWTGALEEAPYFYVKANFAGDPQLYEIGGYPGHTDEPAKFTAPYVFVVNGTAKAYLLNVNLIYPAAPESIAYEGTVEVNQTHPQSGQDLGTTTEDQTVTVSTAEDGSISVTFSGFAMPMAVLGTFNEFTIPNVDKFVNEDGSITYHAENFQVVVDGRMPVYYNGTLEGSQESEDAAPTFTVTLVNATIVVAVFNPNSTEPTPEPAEYAGMIKQILSHPDTGVQGQATDEQTVKIEAGEDGKVNITYSGFTMPVTGAEIPEFTVEGVTVTENEDGSISYLLEENEDGEMPTVVIDRGTGTVTYKVALEGTQESADATPVLKLVLDNSVVDTVWFGADEKTIDKAIVTGINGVNALGIDGTIFDLSGRKVEKIQRAGIYIVNGKKVSIK